ncbi:MAG: hypothetical protein AAB875_06020 [Patescibacteria group bacterium]
MTLTQKDLDAIRDLVGLEIDEKLEQKLDEKLKNFPTKEEFFEKMDEVMVELKAIREDHAVLVHQVSGHEDRITTLEKTVELHPSP